MDLAKKEYLIQECLAGRMRMRARCAGVLHSTMLSRHRAEGAPALSENENAQRRTYRTEIRQKAVEEYLSGMDRRNLYDKSEAHIGGASPSGQGTPGGGKEFF